MPDPADLPGVPAGTDLHVLLGWVVRPPGWLAGSPVPVTTLLTGPGVRRAVAAGRVASVATRLSAVPGLLQGRLRPEVAVVGAVEVPGGWRLVGSPGFALVAARVARRVVIERWPVPAGESAPAGEAVVRPALGSRLPECQVAGIIDRAEPPDPPPVQRPGPAHERIGRLVADLVPDGATVQWGPGTIGASVVSALTRPVRVRSGLVTDELVTLADKGLLAAPAEAAYLWGGPRLHDMVAKGSLVLREVAQTHDLSAVSATERFVAINTALQVGLDGAANVEVAGGRIVAGPGGHPDFAAGASRSPGGLSIVALTATTKGRSNIVGRPEAVSTPRSDVDVVVTEYGVADLRGCPDRERARRILAVAAPEHREGLAGL